jgi:lipopolysaccharide export LptBFGC system permease protein LptF
LPGPLSTHPMSMSLGQKLVAGGALIAINLLVWVAGASLLASGALSGIVGLLIFAVVIAAVGASSLGIGRVVLKR